MEYQTKVNATKEAAVKQLKDEFGQYSGFIFADYRGLTVAQLSEKDQPTSVTIHRTESVPKPIDIVKLKRIVDEIKTHEMEYKED